MLLQSKLDCFSVGKFFQPCLMFLMLGTCSYNRVLQGPWISSNPTGLGLSDLPEIICQGQSLKLILLYNYYEFTPDPTPHPLSSPFAHPTRNCSLQEGLRTL